MAPLLILLCGFALLFVIDKLIPGIKTTLSLKGRIPLSLMLLFTGIAHFTRTEQMMEMLPEIMPMKKEVIYVTGIMELAASIGLLLTKLSRLTSILLIIFFVAILPANIIGSIKQVNLAGMQHGVNYLYYRIPLQLFLIFWTYYFGIKLQKSE